MPRNNETPAQKAERLTRRTGYLQACRTMRDPNVTWEARQAASQVIDEYDAWVIRTLLDSERKPL